MVHATLFIISRKYFFGFSKSAPTPRYTILDSSFPPVMRSRIKLRHASPSPLCNTSSEAGGLDKGSTYRERLGPKILFFSFSIKKNKNPVNLFKPELEPEPDIRSVPSPNHVPTSLFSTLNIHWVSRKQQMILIPITRIV